MRSKKYLPVSGFPCSFLLFDRIDPKYFMGPGLSQAQRVSELYMLLRICMQTYVYKCTLNIHLRPPLIIKNQNMNDSLTKPQIWGFKFSYLNAIPIKYI